MEEELEVKERMSAEIGKESSSGCYFAFFSHVSRKN